MLRADAVVDAVEPGLQIGEDEVDHRHELFGHFGVAAFGNCMVVEAPLAQAGIAAPIVGDDQRAWHDGTLDKATQGIGAAVSSDGQSHSTGIAAILPLVLCRARLPVANLRTPRRPFQICRIESSPANRRKLSVAVDESLTHIAVARTMPSMIQDTNPLVASNGARRVDEKIARELRPGRGVPGHCRANHLRGGEEKQSSVGQFTSSDTRVWPESVCRAKGSGTAHSLSRSCG